MAKMFIFSFSFFFFIQNLLKVDILTIIYFVLFYYVYKIFFMDNNTIITQYKIAKEGMIY